MDLGGAIQTNWHQAFFLPIGADDMAEHSYPSGRLALASVGLLPELLRRVVALRNEVTRLL